MYFASDNAGPAHPKVIEALTRANEGYAMPYGDEPLMDSVRQKVRDIFEAPEAAVYLVATGTAANALILATLTKPWETIFCSDMSHVHEDECNGPEFFTGGAKLTLVPTDDAKMTPDTLRAAIEGEETRGVHGPQRGPVSITNVTERSTVYSVAEIEALCAVAKSFNLPVHLDGARFANAVAACNCSPADMTWKAGVDAVSFGGTKNGLMGVECVIFFDPDKAWEFELRRKRAAQLFSKHRYLAAQMEAYLTDDLWLTMARSANAACAKLVAGIEGAGGRCLWTPGANMAFMEWSRAGHQRLHEAGAAYYLWDGDLNNGPADEPLPARLVCEWSSSDDNIERFISLVAG